MKNRKTRTLALVLAVVMAFGLAAPALAAGQTFSDVPESYWGYADIEAVAAAGYMNGTGNGAFSPEMKVSVAQFLTLLGRLVFPDVKTEGSDWFGPYVTAAQEAGLLTGSQVDVNNVEAEISRYDMAVSLRAAAKKLGVAEKAAQSSEVTDYGMVPTMYADAVLAVYGMGLIKGDGAGNFNGSNTMMRAEVATVIMRLAKAKPGGGSQGEVTDPQPTPGPEQPSDATYYLKLVGSVVEEGVLLPGERTLISCVTFPNAEGMANAPYGEDRSGFICTSSNPSVVQTERDANGWSWSLTALSLGTSTVQLVDPNGVSAAFDVSVVSARESVSAKTYTVSVRLYSETHTIRGNAYTKSTTLYETPFKLYYTRDGGKTSQLIAEGKTPADRQIFTNLEDNTFTVELPEDAFYSQDAGLYVSAETELDGQPLVTSDLRTDGRTNIRVERENAIGVIAIRTALTPPEGEKSHFTFKGYVERGDSDGRVSGATIRLYHKNGALIGETTSRADGTFEMECTVDALDGGFNKREDLYRIVAWGYADGVYAATNGIRKDGSLVLRSLVALDVAPELDREGPGGGNFRVTIYLGADPVN